MQTGAIGLFVLAVLLNIAVSIFLSRRQDLDKTQKTSQITIVWLIPFFGSIGLWLSNRSHDENAGTEQKPFGGGSSDGGGIAADEGGGSSGGD